MDVAFLIGRVLFGLAIPRQRRRPSDQDHRLGWVRGLARGALAKPATQLTGVQILLGGLSVILGVWGDLGSLLLVAFLVATAVLMHGFWRETDPMSTQMEMVQFQKDVALAGAALAFYWVFSQDPGLTLTDSLF